MTKRTARPLAALALMLAAILAIRHFTSTSPDSGLRYVKEEGFVHGTIYHITYESPGGKSLKEEYEKEFKRFDQSLSTFEKNSIISRVNQNDNTVRADSLFANVLHEGRRISQLSHGAFDMTVAPLVNAWGFGFDKKDSVTPAQIAEIMKHTGWQKVTLKGDKIVKTDTATMLDASAIAKGYSSDVTAALLERHGIKNYMVELGGECVVKGVNPQGKPWTLGIQKPEEDSTQMKDEIQAIVAISQGAIATSGNYRQFYYKDGKKYAHTVDPHTGFPVSHNLLSTTIYAPKCITADALATACMVMGVERGKELIDSLDGIEGYFVFSDEKDQYDVIYTSGFEKLMKK